MAEVVIRFDLRFGSRTARLALAGAMLLAASSELASESVNLTTYYPAPSGVYTNLTATGVTYLARDSGPPVSNGSYVDIATSLGNTTGVKLAVGGSVVLVPNNGTSVDINPILPNVAGTPIVLQVKGNTQIDQNLEVVGNETINGNLTVVSGPTTFDGGIIVNNGSITGNYGLAPKYAGWASFGVGDGGAAIYNDNASYKGLMVVGNNISGYNGGDRVVGMWDDVAVNLRLAVGFPMAPIPYPGATIDANGPIMTRENSCTMQDWSVNGTCPGNTYATSVSGIYANYYAMGLGLVSGYGDAVPNVPPGQGSTFLCCPCPTGGCVF